MSKRYDQYCPIAHALDLVGERWSLLIVRELLQGPKRYTDLAANLPGIGTNILAARLRDLEGCGVVTKRRLEPPAASQIYELTPYGQAIRPVIRQLALWGLQSLDAPTDKHEPARGWLYSALDTVFAPVAPPGSFMFRVCTEVASIVDGRARPGPIDHPDVLVEAADPAGFYHPFVERNWANTTVKGDRALLQRLFDLAAAPNAPASAPG